VALYPINMAFSSIVLATFWKHAFVDTNLAPNKMTQAQKQKRMQQDRMATAVNLLAAALAFVWFPITLFIMMVMPFLFVVPEFLSKEPEE
jgi:hypothetical protein